MNINNNNNNNKIKNQTFSEENLKYFDNLYKKINLIKNGVFAVQLFPTFYFIKWEKKFCGHKYGDEYHEYIKRTPRYMLVKGKNKK